MVALQQEREDVTQLSMFERFGKRLRTEVWNTLPEWLKESPLAETRVVARKWGDITIACSPMAEILTNAQLKTEVQEALLHTDPDQYEDNWKAAEFTIESSGIPIRHRSPRLSPERTPRQVKEDAIANARAVFAAAIDEAGWDPADVGGIIVSNLNFEHEFTVEMVAGLGYDTALLPHTSERTACAGALIGLITAMTDKRFKGKKIAIISAEPSGHLQVDEHYNNPENVAVPATFTDLTTVTLIDTAQYDLLDHKIRPIRGGGIDVDVSYGEELQHPLPYPPELNIEFDERDNPLIYTAHGFFMDVQKPNNGMTAIMRGLETLKFFREYTGPFIEYFFRNESLTQVLSYVRGFHEASKAVLKRITTYFLNQAKFQKQLKFDFTLDEIGTGNGTSATIFMNLLYNIIMNNPDPDSPIALFAMGIGAAFAGAKLRRKSIK